MSRAPTSAATTRVPARVASGAFCSEPWCAYPAAIKCALIGCPQRRNDARRDGPECLSPAASVSSFHSTANSPEAAHDHA